MRLSVLQLLRCQRREERADEDEGEGGGGGESDEDVNHGEDEVDVEDEGGQPEHTKRRRPKAFTAASAPPGHAKQIFLPDPNKKDRMMCILCRERSRPQRKLGVPLLSLIRRSRSNGHAM